MRLFFVSVFCIVFFSGFAQDKTNTTYFDLNYFKGNIGLHNKDILHLIKGHPEGMILSWNKKTYGFKEWEQRFNYPDFGVTYAYQNMKNDVLGNVSSLYAHLNFYFFKRNLMLRIGQGLGYTGNPYDKENNYRNIAYGTKLLASTLMMLNFKKERVFNSFGIQGGLSFIHLSNGNFKAPNASTNLMALNFGVIYTLDDEDLDYKNNLLSYDNVFKEKIKYNFTFRSGINESDVVGSGQFPFYIFSIYADKRINRKSALQFGSEVFFSNFLKELIYYKSVSIEGSKISGDEDYKRIGVFLGHELFINKLSFISQLGYYAYYRYEFEGRIYSRIGLKRYVGKNRKWFGVMSLKTHWGKAEAVEFGIGVRL